MPGFDSIADTIAGSYGSAPTQATEDAPGVTGNGTQSGSAQLEQMLSGDTTRSGAELGTTWSGSSGEPLTRPGTTTAGSTSSTLPFGFQTPEEAATGVPTGFSNPAASNPAMSCCQQCSIAAQQENIAKESVCSTMKTRVEAWFLENGCPIQIISLPGQQPGQPSPCEMMQMMQQQQFMVPQQPTPCDIQQQQMMPYMPQQPYPSCSTGTCGMS